MQNSCKACRIRHRGHGYALGAPRLSVFRGLPHGTFLLIESDAHTKRAWSPDLSPASRYKGSRIALSVETGNAESPTQMYVIVAPLP